ncbi:MAG: acetylglutamate kinase [Actinobacteria bacterium]|nr:acetylglutamate kinase [Actinomycetota bacterium]NDH81127.1 acetylglutamate kinase [Actinomycetota bacterium]
MMIVKFGGHAIKDEAGLFAHSIGLALSKGEKVIVVHGGGPQINSELSRLNIESTFVNGFRYTTEEIFAVVDQVLTKVVGPEVASNLVSNGIKAQSISGKDSRIFSGFPIEGLGKVGKISKVDIKPIQDLLDLQIVPVIAPIAVDDSGGSGLNVNADLAAAAISAAYDNSTLIIMTDVAGIYRNWPDENSLIREISSRELTKLKSSFSDGMLPKVEAALEAVDAGARTVRIIDGTNEKSFEEALLGYGGTLVHA